jgi:hypothetical protein
MVNEDRLWEYEEDGDRDPRDLHDVPKYDLMEVA